MNEEKLSFVVSLNGTFWERKPQFSVWLDDHVIVQSEISADPHNVVFDHTVSEGDHTIKVRLENKTSNDTIVENGVIIKDMLLNIKDISIEGASLGNVLWSAEYILDQPQQYNGQTVTKLDGCINLGWNGTYVLKFSSPFYPWLLEQL